MPCKFLITTLGMGSYRKRLRINHIPLADASCIPKNDVRSKNTARFERINIQDRIVLLVAETISETATDAQKPPSPQQAPQQQQPSQQQQLPGIVAVGTVGGGDGTPAATPTSAGNVQQSQQSQQAVPSATPTPTTANPHSTAGPPSSNQPSPHPSPLYPVIPQQAGQPNGSTQGKPGLQVSVLVAPCAA